ncbi:hypothetical protein HZB78_04555 [Candidatus Collierbacteria bacterium]|nr:hypothetical protein [Candidatus Collierbacteria bacterium]
MIDVRSSSQFICQNLEFVKIDSKKINIVAKKIAGNKYAMPKQGEAMPFKGRNFSESAMWCFLVDALNFCFWPAAGKEKWQVKTLSEKWKGGYFGLIEALKTGIKKNRNWLNPEFLSLVRLKDVVRLLEGRGELQLLAERKTAINELGRGLKNENSAMKIIKDSDYDVIRFVDSVINAFPSFKDETKFQGRIVGFYKRAQILAMDLNLILSQHGIVPFNNINELTAFADYKLPQLFRDEEIFIYNHELENKIDSLELLEKDSREEIEIRGATIFAVELLVEALSRLGANLSSTVLDNILWTEAKARPDMKMHHLTKTIYY